MGAGCFGNRRRKVGEVDNGLADPIGWNCAWLISDQCDVGASVGRPAFAAHDHLVADVGLDRSVRSVVSSDKNQCAVCNSQFNRLVDYTADHRIHVGNHVGEVFLLVCVVSVRAVGCGDELMWVFLC